MKRLLVGASITLLVISSLGCGAKRRARRERREAREAAYEGQADPGVSTQPPPSAYADEPPPRQSPPPPPPQVPASGKGPMLARDTRPVWTGIKKRVGVVHFEDTAQYQGYSGDRRLLAGAAQDLVSEALFQSGAFIVVERERLDHVLTEQGLGQSGIVSQKSAAKVGQVLGLQALITGKITDLNVVKSRSGFGGYYQQGRVEYHARVSVKMIDATTGEIWAQESGEGVADSTSRVVMGGGSVTEDDTLGKRALYAAINQTMGKLVAKAANKPWSGVIASVSKGKIYVTAGSEIGLVPGHVLTVRHLGAEITDPTTGQVLGRETGNVVGKLQIAEHLNERLSVCVSSSGSGFAVGDQVQLDPTQTR